MDKSQQNIEREGISIVQDNDSWMNYNLESYHQKSIEFLLQIEEKERNTSQISENQFDLSKPLIIKNRETTTESLNSTLNQFRREVLAYLKAKFIVEEILQPIQKESCLDMNDQINIEFMHLTYTRALNYLRMSNHTFDQNRRSTLPSEILYLADSIQVLLPKVKNRFDYYFKLLTQKQQTMLKIIWSWGSTLFQSKVKTQKNNIFSGFQGEDYSPEQQINYTHQNYIPVIYSKLLKSTPDKTKRLMKLLNYQAILFIDCPSITSFDDFDNVKQQIIKKSLQLL